MIRKATSTDFDYIYSLNMHPQVNPFLLYDPMDKAAFQLIFDELIGKQVKYIFEADGKAVGMFKLIPLQHRNSHIAYLGGLAIDPAYGGKGFGLVMLHEIIDYAKRQGFLRIELSVAIINGKAIRLYEKAGFQKEGVFRKFTYLKSENRFLDEVVMSWLNE